MKIDNHKICLTAGIAVHKQWSSTTRRTRLSPLSTAQPRRYSSSSSQSYWHSVSQLPITTYLSQNSLMKTKLMAIIRTTLKSSICGYLASSVLRRSAQVTLAGNQNRSFKTYAAKPPAIVAHVSYTQCEWNDVFALSVLILVQSRTESREFLTGGLYHHTQSTFKQSTRDSLRLTSSLTP